MDCGSTWSSPPGVGLIDPCPEEAERGRPCDSRIADGILESTKGNLIAQRVAQCFTLQRTRLAHRNELVVDFDDEVVPALDDLVVETTEHLGKNNPMDSRFDQVPIDPIRALEPQVPDDVEEVRLDSQKLPIDGIEKVVRLDPVGVELDEIFVMPFQKIQRRVGQ